MRQASDASGIWSVARARSAARAASTSTTSCPRTRGYSVDKADPYAFRCETPPRPARWSGTSTTSGTTREWMRTRGRAQRARRADLDLRGAPGLVAARPDDRSGSSSYRELAPQLADYCEAHGLHARRADAGQRAPVLRLVGLPDHRLLRADAPLRHAAGLHVLRRPPAPARHRRDPRLGAVALPADAHGLGYFDGTHLYEHADPRQGFHPEWNSAIFNYGRNEVRGFLISSALFWLEVPRRRPARGRGRLDAVPRLRAQARRVDPEPLRRPREPRGDRASCATSTRPSTASSPTCRRSPRNRPRGRRCRGRRTLGGLGFGMKWNMGWMHDTLDYFQHDPVHRKLPPRRAHVPLLYAFTRELRAAAVARRGGARQGLAARQDAGRRVAAVRQPAAAVRLHVGASGQEAAVHGRRVRPAARVEARREPRLAPAAVPARTQACSAGSPTSTGLYRDEPALHEHDFDAATASVDRRSDCGAERARFLRSRRDGAAVLVVLQLHPGAAPQLPGRRAARRLLARAAEQRRRRSTAAAAWATCGGIDALPMPYDGRTVTRLR